VDPAVVRVPKVVGRFTVTDAAGATRVVEVVENVGESASRMLRAQGGRMTTEQAIAYDRAARELNRRGYVLLDGHGGNFSFVPGPDGKLQVAIFDPGGVVPVRGRNPDLARRFQTRINAPNPEAKSVGRWLLDRGDDVGHDAPLMLGAAEELREALRRDLATVVDARDVGMPVANIPFNPVIGYQQPALRALFAATNPDAAYAAARAAEAARRR
jgi:hypothetical protein